MDKAEGRLYWQCRRGMLELDLMLQRFLDRGLEQLDAGEREVFSRLLDYPDQMLLEYLMGRMIPTEGEMLDVIEKIRRAAGP